jgi:hypothetical protein
VITLTERVKRLLAGNADIGKLTASHLLGLGQPIRIANMAVYLASDEAAITTRHPLGRQLSDHLLSATARRKR